MVEEKDIYKKTKAPRPKAVYHWVSYQLKLNITIF